MKRQVDDETRRSAITGTGQMAQGMPGAKRARIGRATGSHSVDRMVRATFFLRDRRLHIKDFGISTIRSSEKTPYHSFELALRCFEWVNCLAADKATGNP